MTSAYCWGILTPPPHPHFELVCWLGFTQPPLLWCQQEIGNFLNGRPVWPYTKCSDLKIACCDEKDQRRPSKWAENHTHSYSCNITTCQKRHMLGCVPASGWEVRLLNLTVSFCYMSVESFKKNYGNDITYLFLTFPLRLELEYHRRNQS